MLPRKNRIRENADFEAICRYGKSLFCGKIILKVKKNDLSLLRLGISIGVRFSSKAVVRNRAKRQIREFFRVNEKRFQIGWDIVVIVPKGAQESDYSATELEKVLQKNGLINNLSPATKSSVSK